MKLDNHEKINRIRELVDSAEQRGADIPTFLFENGVEPRESGRWIKDKTYKGESKDVFICTACHHWQSVKKLKLEQVMYMNYCPFCGARMEV